MHKRLFPALAVLCLISLIVVGPAHAVYLDSSWYADLTNVRTYGGNYSLDPFRGDTWNSAGFSASASSGSAAFHVIQSGQSSNGVGASWGTTTLDPLHTMGSISFDYETHWTQRNLALVVETFELGTVVGSAYEVVWSSSLTGVRTGHVTINANPNGYQFSLVAVPEPGSLMVLGSLFVAGALARARRRW